GRGVFANVAGLFDERVDMVAATARAMSAIRVTVTLAAAVLTGLLVDWRLGAAWAAIYLILETLTQISSAPLAQGGVLGARRRLGYLASVTGQGLAWCGLAAVYWSIPEGPFRLAAMTLLAG